MLNAIETKTAEERTLAKGLIDCNFIKTGATTKLFGSLFKMRMSVQITFKFLVKFSILLRPSGDRVTTVTISDRINEIQIK